MSPVRNHARHQWSIPTRRKVSGRVRGHKRARNVREMTTCVVCHRVVCPLLHCELTCAQRNGVAGNTLYILRHR